MLYDITPPITEALKVWPTDTPPSRELLAEISQGETVTLSTLHATVHLGAHADAPSHYARDGASIDQRSLDLYLGACQVMRVVRPSGGDSVRGRPLGPDDLSDEIRAPRVLFATGTYPDPTDFNEDFAALSPELVEHLADRGVILVGIDTPSVDLFTSKGLPAHQACWKRDMAVLEGLSLADVPDGVYELIALPLKLVGFDASPVRAVLRT